MPLPDLLQVQSDELLGVGMRLVTVHHLLAGVGREGGGQSLLGAGREEDLLGRELVMDLLGDEMAGIERAAGGKAEDEHHDRLQNDDAPTDCGCHCEVSFVYDFWSRVRTCFCLLTISGRVLWARLEPSALSS